MTVTLKLAASSGSEASARTARERGGLYGFLAEVFRAEPTRALLRKIRERDFLNRLSAAGATLAGDFPTRAEAALLEELAVEYTRLFLGPGKHIPPNEGAQVDGALWGKSTSEVASFIRSCGFDYHSDYRDLPDHISVELQFMQALCRREAAAWGREDYPEAVDCLDMEREFITRHLSRWVPLFSEKVVRDARLPFYREMAALTSNFIQFDSEGIERSANNGKNISP